MKTKQIVFTAKNTAELLESEIREPEKNEVLIEMAFTTISAGTEKANLTGDLNVNASEKRTDTTPHFPRYLGYSGAGTVIKTGPGVTKVKPGDRVAAAFGTHSSFCVLPEERAIPIRQEEISLSEASLAVIATFPLAALRKVKPEIGESALVMGLGILGLFAVQFARTAGLVPVIAADPVASRREFALLLGADFALDPTQPDFADTVKRLTGGGANVAIEVTGLGKGLDQALDCMARFGRVSLLGCTRNSDFTIDYYRKIHYPGITLIGAHTNARPERESHPNYWAYPDEIGAIFQLAAGKRIDLKKMIHEIHSPQEAPEVFRRLAFDKDFPIGVQFDWSRL